MERTYKRDQRSPVPKDKTVSKVMSRIKGSNTGPELLLRKALFNNGLSGYRINYKKLPGRPDIVYIKRRLAIFVHGCYWHGCSVCGWKAPKHNSEFWLSKIRRNKERDEEKKVALEALGYKVITVWEHELKKDLSPVVKQIGQLLRQQ